MRGTLGLLALLDLVLGAVEVPVVAAGGLATARSVAAVLAAGAAAARVGTRFIATHEALEAGAHRVYVDALLSARGEDTVLTEAFSVGWPSAPHRVLTSCVEAASAPSREPMGETTLGDQTFPVPRWAVMSPNATTVGEIARDGALRRPGRGRRRPHPAGGGGRRRPGVTRPQAGETARR